MIKVLHISEKMDVVSGGAVIIRRNLSILQNYYGISNVIHYELQRPCQSKIRSLWTDIIELGFYGLNAKSKGEIRKVIEKNHICLVFLDSSNLGILAKLIKMEKINVNIITFFHNIESHFFMEEYKLTKKFKYLYRIPLSYINEKYACAYSDKTVALNERDGDKMNEYYGRKPDKLIPISLFDSEMVENNCVDEKIALFVGSNFPPNINGISFFIEKVLPFINVKLLIAGSGMEELKFKYDKVKNLEILGFVEDLSALYANANIVVLPIFVGSGMKVKTAEALKYGKYLIAAPEALVGYSYTEDIAICCHNASEFIRAITEYDFSKPKYNWASRKMFETKYSYKVIYKSFCEIFGSL